MIYTDLTKKALRLCFKAHKEQVDKSGIPYVFHPFHLAEQMSDEDTAVVALLHDVMEDAGYSEKDLLEMGFPERIVEALALLTHDKKVPYMEYVLNIRHNSLAKAVKIEDLKHNSDVSRLEYVTPNDERRVRKYTIAAEILKDDVFDERGGYFVKRIPLDTERYYFLSVFYTPEKKVIKFSLDVEAASDSHYEFDFEGGNRVLTALNSYDSLPEAVAEYLADHNEYDLVSLMESYGVKVKSFHYD